VKALFLDFDGVILTLRTLVASEFMGHSNAAPDPVVCELIRRVCATGVWLVISSSWRDSERLCKQKLAEGGLLVFLHEDWRTGDCGYGQESRALEIADWLKRHPEVTDYRIADDDQFAWTSEQDARWLKCHPYDGMPAMAMKELAEWAGVVRTQKPRGIPLSTIAAAA
jgi:hypothetical protein